MNQYLEALRGTPEFQELIRQVKTKRPSVPAYDPSSDNTERWKADSMMQQGFDLCLVYFGETNE